MRHQLVGKEDNRQAGKGRCNVYQAVVAQRMDQQGTEKSNSSRGQDLVSCIKNQRGLLGLKKWKFLER